jgi:CheY-like chemotaxis protein
MQQRVLIIEDEQDIREAMAEALADEGYEVSQAKNGMDGLRRAHEEHPSVILLDLMMPVMDGWQFRAAQRDDPEIAGVPVVIVSAAPSKGLQAAAYLHKPFELLDLLSVVEQQADPHRSG